MDYAENGNYFGDGKCYRGSSKEDKRSEIITEDYNSLLSIVTRLTYYR